jgi:hypothetical protein
VPDGDGGLKTVAANLDVGVIDRSDSRSLSDLSHADARG